MARIPRRSSPQERRNKLKDRKGRAHAVHLAGLRHMLNSLDIISSQKVEIGVLGPKSIKKIGVYHELGTNTIPPRPFIRPVMQDMARAVTEAATEKLMELAKDDFNMKSRAQKGRLDVPPLSKYKIRKTMKREIGLPLQREMKGRILQRIPPPLQPATIASKKRKGYRLPTTPLYATGTLYKSIKYRIVTMTAAGRDADDAETEG